MVVQKGAGGNILRIYQPYKHRILTSDEFIEDIRLRVKNFVDMHKLIKGNETILLGLSGGKDSFVLLDVLSMIHPVSKLIAVSIIEGIPGYNKHEDIMRMKRMAKDYGVDVIITSFREYVGHSLYEIVKMAWKRRLKVSACTFCGILRRRILNMYARMHGASFVATGHNLDDTAQTMLINILRGDIDGLIRMHPRSKPPSSKMVPRIKPLRMVYEWETSLYAYIMRFPFQETECMYITSSPTLRAKVRRVMQRIETEEPGTLLRMVKTLDDILTPLLEKQFSVEELPLCPRCGEPMNVGRPVCKLCELFEKIGVSKPIYQMFYNTA